MLKTSCILGHRDFKKTDELELKLKKLLIDLIEIEGVNEFLFGSKSKFTDFCYDIVSELKNKYPNIKRIFIRAEYPIINNNYYNYLKRLYEDSYFYSEKLISNKFSYIRRNQVMINKSDICIFYFNNDYDSKQQSGTRIAYEYAVKKDKKIAIFVMFLLSFYAY